jgi:predicted enzyme related to lactoylglutathione lyase
MRPEEAVHERRLQPCSGLAASDWKPQDARAERGRVGVARIPSRLERASPLERKTLGLSRGSEYTGSWAEFATEPTTLCLRTTRLSHGEAAKHPQQRRWVDAPAAVALAVDDVAAAVEELRAQGVAILVEPWETAVCFKAFIADPFGNPICLHQRKNGTAG